MECNIYNDVFSLGVAITEAERTQHFDIVPVSKSSETLWFCLIVQLIYSSSRMWSEEKKRKKELGQMTDMSFIFWL